MVTAMMENGFSPDSACPPGESVLGAMEELGMTKAELAQRMGYSLEFIQDLLCGRAEVTPEVAVRLFRVVGSPPGFWLRYEDGYRQELERMAKAATP